MPSFNGEILPLHCLSVFSLILSQLPRHPEFNKTEHADAKAKLKRVRRVECRVL